MVGASQQCTRLDDVDTTAAATATAVWTDFLPRLVPAPADATSGSSVLNRAVDARTASTAFRATFSSLLKHLLTEADKIALSLTSSAYDQGIFAVANNYGSLVARLILLPIEESARLTFSSLAADLGQQTSGEHGSSGGPVKPTARQRAAVATLERQLDQVLMLVTVVGTAFAVFGPCYARVAVRLLFGRQYQSEEAVRTLAMICVNVLVLAWNGVSEAFVHAVMPSSAFMRMNAGFVASSATYVVLVGPCVARAGTSGLVAAGAASMLLRIGSNVGMIAHILASVADARPHASQRWTMLLLLLRPSYLAAVGVAAAVAVASSDRFASSSMDVAALVQHVGVGAAAFTLFCGVAAWNVRSTGSLSDMVAKVRQTKKEE
jgi:oligosaccharide translocation protein RFT1